MFFRPRDVVAMMFEALLEKVGLRKPFGGRLVKHADGTWRAP